MVQLKTILIVADNTGAKTMQVIHAYGGFRHKFAYVGDMVKCVVKEAAPEGTVKNSEMVIAVVCRCRKERGRKDGSYIRFDDNAGVIIDNQKDKNPRGTRIFGPIARELKEKGFTKIVSMAEEVL